MRKKAEHTVKIEVTGAVVQVWTGTDAQSFTYLNKLKRQQTKFVRETGQDWPLRVTITNLVSRPPKMKPRQEVKPEPPPVKVFVPDW